MGLGIRFMVSPMKVGHGITSSLKFIKRQRPRVFSMTEMDLGKRTELGAVRSVFGDKASIFSKDKGGHSQEIPIVLRRVPWVRVVRFDLFKLTKDGGPKVGGMGNDRWLARLEFKKWRKTHVYYATHTNAGVQHVAGGPDEGKLLKSDVASARWLAYEDQMRQIELYLTRDIADPRIDVVSLGGDLNMLPIKDGLTEKHSPHQTFKRLKMEYVNTRVVYFATHGARIKSHKFFPPGRNGWLSDHGAILARVG